MSFLKIHLQISQQRTWTLHDADNMGRVVRIDFDTLCGQQQPHGAMDYRCLGRAYDVIVIENIPIMDLASPDHHNHTRRFITFIDELYSSVFPLTAGAI